MNEISTIATVVIACSTVFTAIITWVLARENRLLRKAETEPEIVAYLERDNREDQIINFVLANVGRGPAKNVSFEFNADEEDFRTHGVQLANNTDRKAMSFLPQGESIRVFFGVGHQLVKKPRLSPFEVSIKYQDMKSRRRSGTYQLDLAQFTGLSHVQIPGIKEIAQAVEKIEKHFAHSASGFNRLKVETITSAEAREIEAVYRQSAIEHLENTKKEHLNEQESK